MANPFDQFDAAGGNPFDRFDKAPAKPKQRPETPKPVQHSTLSDLWTATKNTLGGVAEGVTALPDVATQAASGVMRYAAQGATALNAGIVRAAGGEQTARNMEASGAQFDRALSQPFTLGGMVQKVAPPQTDTAGKIARFGAQMIGGAMVPIPTAKAPIRAPGAQVVKPAQQVVQDAEQNSIRVLTSDVKQPRTFVGKATQALGERVPLLGTGGIRSAQQGERVAAVQNLAREYGAASGDEATAPAIDGVMADFAKTRGATVAQFARQKASVIQGTPGVVATPNTAAAIDAQIAKFDAVGTPAAKSLVGKLQGWKQALADKDLPTIDLIRAEMGDAFKDPSLASIKSAGEKSLQSIYGPMKKDMGAFIKANGGPEKLAQWNRANANLSSMADELKVSTLRGVLRSGKGTPEDVAKILFSNKRSLVTRLYNNMSGEGRTKAQAAILQRALEKAGGMEATSPEKFITQTKQLAESIGVMFTGADAARIDGLVRALKLTTRAAQAGVMTNSGQQAVPFLVGGAAVSHPWLVGGGALLARAYESAPVRNLLLGLSKTAPGSAAESKLMGRITAAIDAVAVRHADELKALNDNAGVSAAAGEGQEQQQEQQPAL